MYILRFALKLLDKKRIKAKKGEILAVNERNMLAKVLSLINLAGCIISVCDRVLQISSPFVVNLYYAFQTSDKLCFILDLMNGMLYYSILPVVHCLMILVVYYVILWRV